MNKTGGGILIAVAILLPVLFIVILGPATSTAAADQSANCARPADETSELETIEDVELDTEQIANARLILGIAAERPLPRRAAELAIATSLFEAELRNVDQGTDDNPNSRGLFQQQPEFYPGVDLTDPKQAVNAFYDQLTNDDDWENRTLPASYTTSETVAKALTDKYWEAADNPTDCLAPIEANGDLATVEGIVVDANLAPQLQQLLAAARADNIILGGWGWRDPAAQIRLRRQNCGPTQYDIYQKPSGTCSPPTARPGRSQHEIGLAIDFTCNGGKAINARNSPCYIWLANNAARYGLINLPSEPWHWSTTGR